MSEQPVLAVPEPRVIRDELQRLVLADLLGPLEGEHEEFTREDPLDRYPLGRLAPRGEVIEPETQDELAESPAAEPEEVGQEPSAPNMASLALSSIGFTATVAGDVDQLEVTAKWGRYERVVAETEEGLPDRVWRRVPMSGVLKVALNDAAANNDEGLLPPMAVHAEAPDVVVRGRIRRHGDDWLVSLFLENRQPRGAGRASADWLFQVELSAAAPDGTEVFLPRPDRPSGGHKADQAEQRGLAMAYRFTPEFAVGHGVAMHADRNTERSLRAVRLTTRTVPNIEMPATDVPDPERDADLTALRDVVLDMTRLADLAEGPVEELSAVLRPLVTGYRDWIGQRAAEVDAPDAHLDGHRDEALNALTAARRAADRIEAGVDLLTTDADARKAFGFANRAMARQRLHTIAADERRAHPSKMLDDVVTEVDVPRNRSWRPFQLAFILLNLPSLANPRHAERSEDANNGLVDLLWFPTGGGKTEAYLGLTAFTLAVRRLQPAYGGLRADEGVAVLMRYTLRLLTIQQFERATTLICAAEVLRRADEATWGSAPFRIGLWVGGRVTPNRTDHAADWVKEIRRSSGRPTLGQGSPHQLTSCPWCGTAIEKGRDIEVEPTRRRTLIQCPDVFCPFGSISGPTEPANRGLPVLVVDEEIYRHPPSLLIATVDKFAQLPWKGETAALFGRVSKRCEQHGYLTEDLELADWEKARHPGRVVGVSPIRPPDLIIQDELHLISGPLGSLVGLYETAVDRLATWKLEGGRSVRPKVIASTATVRRANQQIKDLFYRKTEVFPPPGLTIDDSYFARQRPIEERPGRRYVGICAHGSRIKSTLIRVYVSVLGAAQRLHEQYGRNEVTDPYMTLVGYFNSLRDLGGMRRLVEDDVSARLARADARGLARRYDPKQKELTSRLSSDAIRPLLDELKIPFTGTRPKGSAAPIDVLLATNMIAVGVDVSRLGVMVVTNQPKSTAEYIQATSRVGRQAPGLVFTVYNWARPRDLSHYETFEHFHQTFYRRVEALSVTPFADRAIDRGLTGVMVALVRELEPAYNGNLRAQDFDRHSELADHVVRYLGRRAVGRPRHITQRIIDQLDLRLDMWARERAIPGRRLAYDQPRVSEDIAGLLHRPGMAARSPLVAPTSLRDVEPGVQLQLLPGIDPWDSEPAFRAPADDADMTGSAQ
ncbi:MULTISPECIES: DISARM system helicase DrmA [Saccharothrix]|uniref:DISARM system helicase DrmA n=1 Tax=Saccharothrix TaxID=2071 RepID=UPI00116123B7|nr:DISARM system helicase DrmA [Saccharothrix sp. CB00851]